MQGYVYTIYSKVNNKYYVGITANINERWRNHKRELNTNKHHNKELLQDWQTYGENNFEWNYKEVIINQYEDLYKIEIETIAKFDSFHNGYNETQGGGSINWGQKAKDDDLIVYLCIEEICGSGFGKSCEEYFGWAKATATHLKNRDRFPKVICKFEQMTLEEKKKIAEKNIEEIKKIYLKRQLQQGGSVQAYTLTRDDYNFAFAAQELGYTYRDVAIMLNIKPATVKDWFNGRHRKKDREIYNNLSNEEKEKVWAWVNRRIKREA